MGFLTMTKGLLADKVLSLNDTTTPSKAGWSVPILQTRRLRGGKGLLAEPRLLPGQGRHSKGGLLNSNPGISNGLLI